MSPNGTPKQLPICNNTLPNITKLFLKDFTDSILEHHIDEDNSRNGSLN